MPRDHMPLFATGVPTAPGQLLGCSNINQGCRVHVSGDTVPLIPPCASRKTLSGEQLRKAKACIATYLAPGTDVDAWYAKHKLPNKVRRRGDFG